MTGNRHVRFGGGRLETQVKLCAGRLPYFVVLCPNAASAEQALALVKVILPSLGLSLSS